MNHQPSPVDRVLISSDRRVSERALLPLLLAHDGGAIVISGDLYSGEQSYRVAFAFRRYLAMDIKEICPVKVPCILKLRS